MKVYYEDKREAMYRNIKYWGKKPHNIWNELIKENTKAGDVVFDPFLGSGVSFFESVKLGRIPIGMDINAMSGFIVDVYSHKYEEELIKKYFNIIYEEVTASDYYQKYYIKTCESCGKRNHVSNYIWEESVRFELRFKCANCLKDNLIKLPEEYSESENRPVPPWVPHFNLKELSLINKRSIEAFGGHNISNLWTEHNLYLNVLMFDKILKIPDPYKKVFVLTFLQTVHLTSKMCAVRGPKANRLYSSSWGRPAFLALSKFMEQNPIQQMERSLYGNSGILNALKSVKNTVPSYMYSYVQLDDKSTSIEKNEINHPFYINGDSKKNILEEKSVDFIITDPPYGDIIQYGELSTVWNVWLRLAYDKYDISLDDEIIVNKEKSYPDYAKDLLKVFDNGYFYLKENKKMIFTFNSDRLAEWKVLEEVMKKFKFIIKDIYFQKNRRSSEAQVSATKGKSISDYYIVLEKNSIIDAETRKTKNLEKINQMYSLWRDNLNE